MNAGGRPIKKKCAGLHTQQAYRGAMMDAILHDKFVLLRSKMEALIQEKTALKDEIRYYQAENKELRQALGQIKNLPKNFPTPTEKPNIAQENGRYAEKVAAIAKQIDVYVEEIDRCIAQLGE